MQNDLALSWAQHKLNQLRFDIHAHEMVRAMPWSEVSRFITSNGVIYFKQMAPEFKVEPFVLSILHNELSSPVPQVIAANAAQSCFLMSDSGSGLREPLKIHYNLEKVCQILRIYADLQIKAMDKINKFLAVGVKDCRLNELPKLYVDLLEKKELLINDGVTAAEFETLNQLHTKFSNDCEALSRFNIPQTIEHGDFHDNNILIQHDKIIINDWGDSSISHPFFSLGSWLDSAKRHHNLNKSDPRYDVLTQAYLEMWQQYHPMDILQNAFLLSERIRPIIFSISFCRVATCPGMESLGQFKGYIAQALREFIEVNQ